MVLIDMPSPENLSVTFTFAAMTFQDIVSLWPECGKYLCQFYIHMVQEPVSSQDFHGHHSVTLTFDPMTLKM